MMSPMVIQHARLDPASHCLVCGSEIPAGEGLTARHGETMLRFKCESCLAAFVEDPDRYLAGHTARCCDEHDASPASEWSA
ncbi:MAG: hypothetical protein HYX57_12765 [Chloroflexi bacterium]|nr:hypothetical protein [Chloroflexota bacterium]